MANANVMEFNADNWQSEVLGSSMPVVVDFWAVWCGPCRMLTPTIEQLATEYAGQVKVGKVNVDDNQGIASQFGITSIPQVYVFKGGQPKRKLVGLQPKAAFKTAIDEVLKG